MLRYIPYYLLILVLISCQSEPEKSVTTSSDTNSEFIVVDEYFHTDSVTYYSIYAADTNRLAIINFCDSITKGNKDSHIEIYNDLSGTPSFFMIDGLFGTPVSSAKYKIATYDRTELDESGVLINKYGQVLYGELPE